jgi:hypothetical protein
MNKGRSRFTPELSVVNGALEGRLLLSGITPTAGSPSALHQNAVELDARAARKVSTNTLLTVSAGTLGQPITFTVTVRSAAAAGSPVGSVNIIDHGVVIQTLTLSPTTSPSPRYAYSDATYTVKQQPGGSAYFFGKHAVSAVFNPGGTFLKSKATKIFAVNQPAYTTLAGGVKIATIAPGSGAPIQSGQTATLFYTGYLAKGGRIFDDSLNEGGTPFSFTLGAGSVIPGFDIGTAGMQVGETRIVLIPPAEGYGPKVNGPIPANSTLIFVLTLESIS